MKIYFGIIGFYITLLAQANNFKVDTLSIYSEVLKEDREIHIYKPVKLAPSDTVILLYILDGEYSEGYYKQINKEFNNQLFVAIAIPNTDRRRDLIPVNEPDNFLKFIETELISQTEKDFTHSRRILFGHSIAGGFVVYSLINKPQLFDKFIASSPTPIMQMVDSSIYKKLDHQVNLPVKFYFSAGSKDMRQVKKWATKLNLNLTPLSLDNIQWIYKIHEGHNHNSSGYLAIKRGLRF